MSVHFAVGPEVAFDYLVDPQHRPEWQSSLARLEQVTGLLRLPALVLTRVTVTGAGFNHTALVPVSGWDTVAAVTQQVNWARSLVA